MKNNKKTAVIFDIDGTLINSKSKLNADVKEAFYRLGFEIDNSQIENSESWYDLAKKYRISKEEFDLEFNKRKSWGRSLRSGEVSLFKDTIPCLEKLCSGGFILGVLTRSSPEYTKQKLDFYKLNKYFDRTIAITDINAKSKRNEAISLIKKINPSKINLVYFIGDNAEDVLVEKDINKEYELDSKGIWVNRERKPIPSKLKNYIQVYSLTEIPKILERI